VQLLNAGGFALRKWASSHSEVLQDFPSGWRETPLRFNIIYEPNGYLAPVIFSAKNLIQQLWVIKVAWDDLLPENIAKFWENYTAEIPLLSNYKIPRSFNFPENPNLRLIGFWDASNLGYPSDDNDYLSPGHFLIGTPLLAPPEGHTDDSSIPPGQRWKLLTQVTNTFWTRWKSEYANTLVQQKKWFKATPDLKIEDLVYITDLNSSPLCWPLGRISAVQPVTP